MGEVIKELMPYLQKVAEKLGESAQALWLMQLKQAKVYALIGVVEYIVWLVFLVGCVYGVYKITRSENYLNDADEFIVVMGVIACAVFLFITMICMPSINSVITALLNPEYWAVKELLHMIR